MIQDAHADETKLTGGTEYCSDCNATEQGFDYQGESDIPICRICGMEATRVSADEDGGK